MTPRRRVVSTVLALLLAVESVVVVSAAAGVALAQRSADHPLPAASPAGEVLAQTSSAERAWEPDALPSATGSPAIPDAPDYQQPKPVVRPAQPSAKAAAARQAQPSAVKPVVRAAPEPVVRAAPEPKAASYAGRNHVWIPSLGISESVAFFSCTRSAPPENYAYRWGCAGTNNVYLLGHAYGVFKALHDSYVSGRLGAGMTVYYADDSGTTRIYAVRWWRLTKPTTDASWAWAAQAVPSMTLQTCVGANSEYRLMVRLVQVG